jgi:Ca-activated chloride channel family protein
MDPRVLVTTAAHICVRGVVPASQTLSPVPPQGEPPLFSAQSELVVLQVMVEDRGNAYVTDLPAEAFTVREDNVPQMIEFFNRLDAPVTVGLLIDGSGSMASVRSLVAAAAGTFVATSNPEDEAFALIFNEYVRPALSETEPFTSDGPTLRAALLEALFARGRTALYDAIVNGLQYVTRGMHERRVLVAISDGGDNASAATFDEVLRQTQISNTVIYTIALVDPLDRDASPGRLRRLAEASGGEAFEPHDIAHIPSVLQHIARDIRNMYTIGYAPSRNGGAGLRRIRVTVEAPNHAMLRVRARQGYMVEKR